MRSPDSGLLDFRSSSSYIVTQARAQLCLALSFHCFLKFFLQVLDRGQIGNSILCRARARTRVFGACCMSWVETTMTCNSFKQLFRTSSSLLLLVSKPCIEQIRLKKHTFGFWVRPDCETKGKDLEHLPLYQTKLWTVMELSDQLIRQRTVPVPVNPSLREAANYMSFTKVGPLSPRLGMFS